MKKLKVFLIALISSCLLIVPTVYAGTAYTDSIDIDAYVKDDGDIEVLETIVYNISDSLNGVYRDILINSASNMQSGASSIEIESVKVDGTNFTYKSSSAKNGDKGVYNINEIDGGKQIKIFVPSYDQKRRAEICYKLTDVVTKYNDVAELYWNFIGKGWAYGIDNVNIIIHLPAESKTLKIYGHGPLNGMSEIMDNKTVRLTISNLGSNEPVDARALFDTTLVPYAKKTVNKTALEDIVKDETKLAIEANIKRENAKKVLYISFVLAFVSIVIPVVVAKAAKKKINVPEFDGEYYRELPEDYGPAIMNKVLSPLGTTVSPYDMLSTVLDLSRRGYIRIEKVMKSGKTKPTDYKLELINENLEDLNAEEKHLITHMIFTKENTITLKELKKQNTSSTSKQEKAYKEYIEWTKKIVEVAQEKDVIKEHASEGVGKYILGILSSILIDAIIILLSVIFEYGDVLIIGVLSLVINVFVIFGSIYSVLSLNARTKKGVEHNVMWKAFKKFLLHFSKMQDYNVESMAIWEHYLVYAAGLGIADKVIKELKITYPTEFTDEASVFNTYATFCILNDSDSFNSFSNSFTSASNSAFSSSSSGSGSGGAFSGGGGGRWRRRRRRRLLKTIAERKKL